MFDRILVFLASHPRIMPECIIRGLFLFAADITWFLHTNSVRQLERNLEHVLIWKQTQENNEQQVTSVSIDTRTLRTLSRQGMRTYFAYFAEAMTVGARTQEELMARVRGEGDGLKSIIDITRESAAPIAMGHQGNWDYDGFWAQFAVAPVTTVAERLSNEQLLTTFVNIRERLGITILLTGTPHLTADLEKVLRTPHVVVPLLADRDLSRNGEFVHAFGSTIRVARGPATLAYDTGLPLYVVNTTSEKIYGDRRKKAHTSHGYVCTISGPIDIDQYRSLPREEAIHAISQAWVDQWTKGIAQAPQDWHMLQPIFIEDLDLARLKNVPNEILQQME